MITYKREIYAALRIISLGLIIIFLVMPVYATTGSDPLDMPEYDPENIQRIVYEEDFSNFPNPDRGWYRAYFTDDLWGLGDLRRQGISVIMLKVNLEDYIESPISKRKLNEISKAFDAARRHKLQVVFRAAYDFDGKPSCEPKSLDIITGHIKQLENIFTDNEDILFVVQAGFLGPWGEWHSSYYGDPLSVDAMRTVLFSLLEVVPESRSVQVRRPMYIREIFELEDKESMLSEETAFNGSYLSRTGYHNDALLSTENEFGTYVDPDFTRQDELHWVNNHTRFVPFVAETAYLSEKSDPENAVYELDKLNAHLINIDYHPQVIEKWRQETYSGQSAYDYITNRLGYRLVLKEAVLNGHTRAGGNLDIRIEMINSGFGNIVNERDFLAILTNGRTEYITTLNEDPRFWTNEEEVIIREFSLSIPSDITPGNWNLYVALPGAEDDPSYSVRFANKDVWDEKTGYNLISDNIWVHGGEETGLEEE